jgi:hypothetical protein
MQPLKHKFQSPDRTSHGSLQHCVRMNDLDEVGDGTHLTFFQMAGSFGFGTGDYERHVELWTSIVRDLRVGIGHVDVHPLSPHRPLWEKRGFTVVGNPGCVWSDGVVGGYCSELFTPSGLEIGNLVNPMGHSIDVGFGYERLLQMLGGLGRVDETELFRQDLDPVSRDHFRVLSVFYEYGIQPGNKGRGYVCRRVLRRYIRLNPRPVAGEPFSPWVGEERTRLEKSLREGKRHWRRNRERPPEFWWGTFGILPEELHLLG